MNLPQGKAADFWVMLGDFLSHASGPDAFYTGFLDTGVKLYAREKPLVFVRGNHEQIGLFAADFALLGHYSGHTWYAFRQGKVCYVALDAGNDHADEPGLEGIHRNAAMTDEEAKYNKVLALGETDYSAGTGSYGFADGVAEIVDLPIYQNGYQNGYQTSSAPKYQQYVMIETDVSQANVPGQPVFKYSLNKTVYVFSFPMEDQSTHEMKYHYTFDYINGVLRTPSTAGPGMTMFKIIGCLVAVLAVLSLGGYVIYTKRTTKRKTAPKHVAK